MSKLNLQPLKGFRDFLPQEALSRLWLKNKITEIFELWGYDPIETPTLESLEIFKGQIGDGEKMFYTFKDAGERDVALRYDQSVPTARIIGANYQNLSQPFKRYQIQTAFRAEKPQKGRYREFLQCDADIFGTSSPLADAEVIALSLDIYRRLGFMKAVALISDRALYEGIPYKVIVAIDKLSKIGKEAVKDEIVKLGYTKEKADVFYNLAVNKKPTENINIIFEYLKNYGFSDDWYKFDPTIARSFSYSTGPIWEIVIPGFAEGSVLGGERYDKLVGVISGTNIPATGFGLGFDRTYEAAMQFNLIPKTVTKTAVLVTIFNKDLLVNSLSYARILREKSVNVELFSDLGKPLEKQLKYADKKGIRFVVILGPDEVKNKMVTIKDLKKHTQKTVPLNTAVNVITN
jgi:histidyl-tRNA synthetase